jgi:hypothetical protein
MTILNLSGLTPATFTTSGSYDFSVMRDDIITLAMKACGKLGDEEVPTPGDMADGAKFLNMLVKQWMGKQDFAPGLKMWTRQRGTLFLSTNQFSYELGPTGDHWATDYNQTTTSAAAAIGAATLFLTDTSGVLAGDFVGVVDSSGDLFWSTVDTVGASSIVIADVLVNAVASGAVLFNYTTQQQRPLELATVILRDVNHADIPVNKLTLEEYETLPSKTMPTFLSDPMAAYYESQLGNGVLYLDVGGAQDVTKVLHIVFLRPVQDFDNPLDAPEYPQEWYLALVWGLAKQLAPIFNCVWTKEMGENYDTALAIAKEAPAETTALYFQPYAENSMYG